MAHYRWWLCLLVVGCAPRLAEAQKLQKPEVVLIYRDGFSLQGRVHESNEVIFDKATGMRFPVFTGKFALDDYVRIILFSRDQIQKVTPIDKKQLMVVDRRDVMHQRRDIPINWVFDGATEWSGKGERIATYRGKEPVPMKQEVMYLSPRHIAAATDFYRWNLMYFTQEFGPALTRDILFHTYGLRKKLQQKSETQKLLEIAKFMQEAGWFVEAEQDLRRCININSADRKTAQAALDELVKIRTTLFVESIERAANVGQHQEAIARLGTYQTEKYQNLVSPRHQQIAQDLLTKYELAKGDIEQAKKHLQNFPAYTKNADAWSEASEFILGELHWDTIGRLEKFLDYAKQYETQREKKLALTQSAEEVLALAVSGWLQGNQAAEPDAKTALKLAGARKFLLEYLKCDGALKRTGLLSAFRLANDLPVDVMPRVIRMLPPPEAHDLKKFGAGVKEITIAAPDGQGGTYLVQLPPNYHHLRSYPVLMVLHGAETAEATLKRFTAEAAKQGFILVAPLWEGNAVKAVKYKYGIKEHALAVDTLRDLRRRFQIDSDRIFLFGWDEGAKMALDVGLGHPDLFAGVVPMNVVVPPLTRRYYWPNAQYLPFYIIDGERNFSNAKSIRDLFKDWAREPYMATYVEYQGRGTEWYSAEVGFMMDWMRRKKRHHPMKEMGRYNPRGGNGEEFHSTRAFDNRFYWLSTETIADRCQQHHNVVPITVQPATLQAQLSVGNQVDPKTKAAKIWNQLDVRVSGVKQFTFWLTPNMMDYEKDLQIRVNTTSVGGMRKVQPSLETLLEELYYTGDRQRLYIAKIDIVTPVR